MSNILIQDLKKIKLAYSCDSPEKIFERGFVKAHFEVEKSEVEQSEEIQLADIKFELMVDSSPIEPDADLDKMVAKISVTFRMLYQIEDDAEFVGDKILLREVEPFIRKELLEFYNAVGLPNLAIPYGFWKNAGQD